MVVLATLVRRRCSAAALGAWVGPPLMELVFGEGIRLPGGLTALLAVGTVFALANLVLTIAGRGARPVRGAGARLAGRCRCRGRRSSRCRR